MISPQDITKALKRFGHDEFRKGQEKAIQTLLERSDSNLLFVAPTGGGKSLIYQLTAYLLDGTSLVISPLIALMEDQVKSLIEKEIPATFLASTVEQDENSKRISDIRSGKYRIVYVAPERLAQAGLRKLFETLKCPLVAVDEAHCISQWGHDFRPDYLNIKNFLVSLNKTRVIACTATATPEVRDEIIQNLGLNDDTPQHVHGFARPNLSFIVENLNGSKQQSNVIDSSLKRNLRSTNQTGAAIIYSITKKEAETEYKRLQKKGWEVATYHAGMDPYPRKRVNEAFTKGKLEIVVATTAFGMGIDRSDVRTVIHMGLPDSVESYYQQAGRAGRDGKESECLLIRRPADIPKRKFLISNGDSTSHKDHKWELFLELVRWSDGGSCRHDSILRYFGDKKEILQGCGKCDVCREIKNNPDWTIEDRRTIEQKILSAAYRVHDKLGKKLTVALLRGENGKGPTFNKLKETKSWGILREYESTWISQTIDRFISAGLIDYSTGVYPLLIITPAGRNVLRDKKPSNILLPPLSQNRQAKPTTNNNNSGKEYNKPEKLTKTSDNTEDNEELFNKLRERRIQIANRDNVPAFIVFGDKTLRELAEHKPTNLEQLQNIYGIGSQKAEKYGPEFLNCIQSFLNENTIQLQKNSDTKKSITEENEELFNKLRERRTQIAERENVPAPNVASDETLRKLSNIRPKNLAQLKFYEIGPFYSGTESEFLTFIN